MLYIAHMKSIARAMAICVVFSSCATTEKPVTVHILPTSTVAEHDETVSPNGTISDFFPNATSPHEMVATRGSQLMDLSCIDANCKNVNFLIRGSSTVPDGNYQLLQTDDPKLIMLRDSTGDRTLGYLADNKGMKFFPTLQQAQDYEHKGDAARTAGKIALGVLLVGALVAVAAAAAASEAQSNSVTTTCSSFGNSTTCTSR
jgi:hypothetical protein